MYIIMVLWLMEEFTISVVHEIQLKLLWRITKMDGTGILFKIVVVNQDLNVIHMLKVLMEESMN